MTNNKHPNDFYDNNQPASTTKQTTTKSSKNLGVKIHEILAEKSSQVYIPPGPLTALASMLGSGHGLFYIWTKLLYLTCPHEAQKVDFQIFLDPL